MPSDVAEPASCLAFHHYSCSQVAFYTLLLPACLQVRCQAYNSLAAFSFETLESIEALRPLGAYTALLHSELCSQHQQRSQAEPQRRRQQRAAAAALAECEALVQAALAYEHATRRHVTARAGGIGTDHLKLRAG